MTKKHRFFVDERLGCIAVRDRQHPKYSKDYPGLHFDTVDVICYIHGTRNEKNDWVISDRDRLLCQQRADYLNSIFEPNVNKGQTLFEIYAEEHLTPSASVQERAKEIWTKYVVNAPGPKDKPIIDSEMVISAMLDLAGASGNGMQWVKASERIPDGIRVPVKYNGNYNVIYKTGDGYAFDDHEGMRVFPEDWGNILWLDESHSMQGEVDRLRDDDKEFITDALNAYWHEANARLLLTDLGDIERKNYERQLSRSKELMEALTK